MTHLQVSKRIMKFFKIRIHIRIKLNCSLLGMSLTDFILRARRSSATSTIWWHFETMCINARRDLQHVIYYFCPWKNRQPSE